MQSRGSGDKYQNLDGFIGGAGSINKIFNNETFYLYSELSSAWGVLSTQPGIEEYLNKDKITTEINNLSQLFIDEGIVY